MNLALVEKLRSLIALSGILNAAEKQEWETLLELMNDKQMLELEKILAPAKAQVESLSGYKVIKSENEKAQKVNVAAGVLASHPAPNIPQPQAISNIQNPISKPESKPIAKLSLPVEILQAVKQPVKPALNHFAAPTLGHIINLPKKELGIRSNGLDEKQGIAQKKNIQPQEIKSGKGGFLQKLKTMLREPELPAGKEMLEIEAHKPDLKDQLVVENKVPSQKNIEPAKEAAGKDETEKEHPLLVLKKSFELPVPRPPKKHSEEKPPETTAPLQQKSEPKLQTVEEVLANNATIKQSSPKGLEKWPDRYNIHHTPAKKQNQEIRPQAGAPIETKIESQNVPPSGSVLRLNPKTAVVKIQKPEDLEKFEVFWLEGEPEKKLIELSKRFGYHNVIFHLEKSPLYKSYINTGKEILEKSSTFESLSKSGDNVLGKEVFEKTADLLKAIQAE